MKCAYCAAEMRPTGTRPVKEEVDRDLIVTYREREYTCVRCQAKVYTSDNLSDPGPYWVPGIVPGA